MLTESVPLTHPHNAKIEINSLDFRPLVGFASPHLQTILPTFFSHAGKEPPSAPFFIELKDGDMLYGKLSTPPQWKLNRPTIVLIHGLGGSDSSDYMIRMSRKFYRAGYRCLRMNLRGIGKEAPHTKRPYHGGTSPDVLETIRHLKSQAPDSPIVLIGYSLGGNITLKLMGELQEQAVALIDKAIAICAPIDLAKTMEMLNEPINRMYHRYYVKGLKVLGAKWIGNQKIRSISDFDGLVTVPHWGFRDVFDYYQQSSSQFYLSGIKQTCHLLFAADDPFVDYRPILQHSLSRQVKIWLSQHGGHMGFWGWSGKEHQYNWIDAFLMKIVRDYSQIES